MIEETAKAPVTVCDIQFRSSDKVYFFDPGELNIAVGDTVILDTANGTEIAGCVRGNHTVAAHEIVTPLRSVLRLATEQDKKLAEDYRVREKDAFALCQKKIAEFGLDMQLVSVEYAFDGNKVLFFFTSDNRVDFRELVKSLASVLRTRIELRQIGVRDKAKMVGGLGICGRPFCCREFLDDFQPVSIKMAKTQSLSLNPAKISGTCGRLMCCLNYEQEAYEDLLRTSPKSDSFVDTPDGRGTVVDVSLLKQSVRVRLEKQPDTIVCHKNCEICVLRNGKAKRTDEPIPDDLAPISGNLSKKPKLEKPVFSTYLEPVVMRRSAETLEAAVTNRSLGETDGEDTPARRRKRRSSKSHKPSDAAVKPQTADRPAKELTAKPVAKESAPKQMSRETAPKKPVRETDAQSAEEKAKAKNYRRYRKRGKPGTKPEI